MQIRAHRKKIAVDLTDCATALINEVITLSFDAEKGSAQSVLYFLRFSPNPSVDHLIVGKVLRFNVLADVYYYAFRRKIMGALCD